MTNPRRHKESEKEKRSKAEEQCTRARESSEGETNTFSP